MNWEKNQRHVSDANTVVSKKSDRLLCDRNEKKVSVSYARVRAKRPDNVSAELELVVQHLVRLRLGFTSACSESAAWSCNWKPAWGKHPGAVP